MGHVKSCKSGEINAYHHGIDCRTNHSRKLISAPDDYLLLACMGKSDDVLEAWAISSKLWRIFFIVFIFLIIMTVGAPLFCSLGS